MNVELIDIKENQDFLNLEQINSDFRGIILVFSDDYPVGYITYNCDSEDWEFADSISIDSSYYYSDPDLINTVDWIRRSMNNVVIKAIKFGK